MFWTSFVLDVAKNIVNTSILSSKSTKIALNTRFLDEFDVKYLTGSDNDICAYDTLWPWCGRTLPRSGVNNIPTFFFERNFSLDSFHLQGFLLSHKEELGAQRLL